MSKSLNTREVVRLGESTTNGEYGALKPNKQLTHFNITKAQWYTPEHPHWKNPIIADYKNLKSTYADLGPKDM